MTKERVFHDDAKCGACGGPLDCHRDAVCEECVPESVYFEQMAAYQEVVELMDPTIWKARESR